MCAAALAALPIGRVVFGCANDKFGGCGSIMSLHQGFGSAAVGATGIDDANVASQPLLPYAVQAGVQREAAVALLQAFYSRGNARGERCNGWVATARRRVLRD